MTAMSKADRTNLERLARKRAKVAKATIGQRNKVLRAEVEDQLSAEYKVDDELWVDVNRAARAEVAKADAKVAEVCRQLGIPEELRPSISVVWSGRGENMLASRRTELRKLAYARIDAAAETAKVEIDANLLHVETELIRDGLESAEAVAYLEGMPTVEQLMPSVDVAQIELPSGRRSRWDSDEQRGRYGGWKPPVEAAGQLLTPTTASNREERRQAIERALATNPAATNRAIARMVGVDHKTVGRYRADGGEIPSNSGEIPTDGDGGGPHE